MCRYIIMKRGEQLLAVGEYDAEAPARKAAEEMAVQSPACAFEVYQRTGTVMIEPKAVWKGANA